MSRSRKPLLVIALLTCLPLLGYASDEQAASQAQNKQDKQDKKDAVESTRKTRVRLGTVSVGAFYGRISGSPFYRYSYGYGYYPFLWDPFWSYYAPFYHPGYFLGFPAGDDKGEIRLTAEPKKAQVFLDGAYAGTADNLKDIWLDPGAYDLSVKAEHHVPFRQRIYVLSGKKLKVNAALEPEKSEAKP